LSVGWYFFSRARYICVSSVDVTSLRSTSAASLVTGQNATSSRLSGRFNVIGGFVLELRAGRAGPFGSLPGSDGLNMIAGSISGPIAICRS
jgi:hypothetical protein